MKTEAHKRITQHTIQQFLDSMSGPFLTAINHEKKRIIDATETEDVWYKNPRRPFHWHFYHPTDIEIPDHFHSVFKFTLFSHEALTHHIDKFHKHLAELKNTPRTTVDEKENFYEAHKDLSRAIGGILHHIQDMSTPSHVVPVFHGRPAPGGFKPVDDTFETFADKHIGQHLADRHSWIISEDEIINSPPAESYDQLYTRAAKETLEYLKEVTIRVPINNNYVTMDSTVFWKPYDFVSNLDKGKETAGFGCYGPYEKFFNEEGGEIEINGKKVQFAFEYFSHIYYRCLTEMIRNSYRCLKLINEEYNEAIT